MRRCFWRLRSSYCIEPVGENLEHILSRGNDGNYSNGMAGMVDALVIASFILVIVIAKGLWILLLTNVTQTCVNYGLTLSCSCGMWVPRLSFCRTYRENGQVCRVRSPSGWGLYRITEKTYNWTRIDHLSCNSASNCHIFLNKRFVSAKLYKMLGVELLTSVHFGSHDICLFTTAMATEQTGNNGCDGEMGWATALHGSSV